VFLASQRQLAQQASAAGRGCCKKFTASHGSSRMLTSD
jgi:hypothetical protein